MTFRQRKHKKTFRMILPYELTSYFSDEQLFTSFKFSYINKQFSCFSKKKQIIKEAACWIFLNLYDTNSIRF